MDEWKQNSRAEIKEKAMPEMWLDLRLFDRALLMDKNETEKKYHGYKGDHSHSADKS